MIRRQLISDSELCRRYRDGAPRDELVARSGLPDYAVVEVLRKNGEALRCDEEWRRLAVQNRMRWKSTERLKVRQGQLRRSKPKSEAA